MSQKKPTTQPDSAQRASSPLTLRLQRSRETNVELLRKALGARSLGEAVDELLTVPPADLADLVMKARELRTTSAKEV